jgi:hypothetical protein
MNDIESYVVFRAEFPDDSMEANREIITPAGRNIMQAICRHISSTGATTTQPRPHSFYGWTAEFQIGKVTIWMLLQQTGPWLLIIEARASWLTGGKTKADALRQGIAIVGNALSAESRIQELRWMTKEKFEGLSTRQSQHSTLDNEAPK